MNCNQQKYIQNDLKRQENKKTVKFIINDQVNLKANDLLIQNKLMELNNRVLLIKQNEKQKQIVLKYHRKLMITLMTMVIVNFIFIVIFLASLNQSFLQNYKIMVPILLIFGINHLLIIVVFISALLVKRKLQLFNHKGEYIKKKQPNLINLQIKTLKTQISQRIQSINGINLIKTSEMNLISQQNLFGGTSTFQNLSFRQRIDKNSKIQSFDYIICILVIINSLGTFLFITLSWIKLNQQQIHPFLTIKVCILLLAFSFVNLFLLWKFHSTTVQLLAIEEKSLQAFNVQKDEQKNNRIERKDKKDGHSVKKTKVYKTIQEMRSYVIKSKQNVEVQQIIKISDDQNRINAIYTTDDDFNDPYQISINSIAAKISSSQIHTESQKDKQQIFSQTKTLQTIYNQGQLQVLQTDVRCYSR